MKRLLGAALAACLVAPALAQPIVTTNYRPPETVQRVNIPVNPAEQRLRVLIISGQNSYEHDWTGMNNMLRGLMQDSGRFDVRVTEDFDHGSLAMLKAYDVVLLNYSSRWNYADAQQHLWSDEAFKALYQYVREGGGLVAYHSSFTWGRDIPEYKRLIGAAMQPGSSRRAPPGSFPIHIIDKAHPITAGMRDYIWTFNDDMYTNMSIDPEAKIHVLATARDGAADYAPKLMSNKYDPAAYTPEKLKAMKGIEGDHPQLWTADYGKGRVFSMTVGHDEVSLHFAGLQDMVLRGAEWAATGKVTLELHDESKDDGKR
jgi:type 1 glutamine amidotransferase